MLEWLERLSYDTESRQTVVRSRLGFAIQRLKDPFFVNPAVNGYIFEPGKDQAAGDGLRFFLCCAQRTQIPTAPTATRLWETFTFTGHIKY